MRVDAAELQKFVNRHLVPRQFGIRRLDHRKNVQHQLLLAERQAVHRVLDQVVGFAYDRLIAPGAVGGDRGQGGIIGPLGVWLFLGCHILTSKFSCSCAWRCQKGCFGAQSATVMQGATLHHAKHCSGGYCTPAALQKCPGIHEIYPVLFAWQLAHLARRIGT